MSSCKMQTCQRKIFTCAIAALVFLAGLLVVVAFVKFNWHEIVIKDAANLTSDPSDSSYDDCRTKTTVVFEEARSAAKCLNDAKQKAKEPAHKYLEKHHSVAIYTYTSNMMLVNNQHNKTAAKSAGQLEEKEPSGCHFLYSSLSEAIQILKHSQVICVNTDYRSEVVLHYNIANKQFHFGTFVLGSAEWNFSRSASCFEVYTCFGADIKYYSALKLNGQVLIPPYEIFKVTDIQTDGQRCKVTYRLKSTLDCVYDRDSNMLLPMSASPPGEFWLVLFLVCIIIVSLLLIVVIVKVVGNNCKKRVVCSVLPMDQSTCSPAEGVI